jgi:ATP-binding cassette subfamily F protein 3
MVYSFAGIIGGGVDDFEDGSELYEAIGCVLHEVAEDKTESDVR